MLRRFSYGWNPKKGVLDMRDMPNWEKFLEEVKERYGIKADDKDQGKVSVKKCPK